MKYFDDRWIGKHGIGRFASEVSEAIEHRTAAVSGRPMDPFDPVRLSFALSSLDRRDVFFSPGYNAPFAGNARFVLTVHDLNHIDRPENSSASKRIYYALILKRACHRAAAVLTVSDFAKRRIIQWSGVDTSRVFNVGNGVSELFCADGEVHKPDHPYVLCVGNRRLHKNESRVLRAFALCGLDDTVRLIFTGQATDALTLEIESLGLGRRVGFLGTVEDRELSSIYRGALCLAFPSLYEGFGLPVVEAFACGTPVVTSNVTSLPEVAGGAALLVSPESTEEIAAAIFKACTDATTRQRLREQGFVRARAFSWSLVSSKVNAVLEAVQAQ